MDRLLCDIYNALRQEDQKVVDGVVLAFREKDLLCTKQSMRITNALKAIENMTIRVTVLEEFKERLARRS